MNSISFEEAVAIARRHRATLDAVPRLGRGEPPACKPSLPSAESVRKQLASSMPPPKKRGPQLLDMRPNKAAEFRQNGLIANQAIDRCIHPFEVIARRAKVPVRTVWNVRHGLGCRIETAERIVKAVNQLESIPFERVIPFRPQILAYLLQNRDSKPGDVVKALKMGERVRSSLTKMRKSGLVIGKPGAVYSLTEKGKQLAGIKK